MVCKSWRRFVHHRANLLTGVSEDYTICEQSATYAAAAVEKYAIIASSSYLILHSNDAMIYVITMYCNYVQHVVCKYTGYKWP